VERKNEATQGSVYERADLNKTKPPNGLVAVEKRRVVLGAAGWRNETMSVFRVAEADFDDTQSVL
jgi:hypothetical protein